MIWLWVAAALISAAVGALIVQRAAAAAGARSGENPALAVYRRQMAELDELAERGVLADAERRSVRAETGRRLLAAAERVEAPTRKAGPGTILIAAAAAPLIALGLYVAIGAPGYPDQPFKMRLADWRAADPETLEPGQMAAILRQVAAERPTDPEPLRQLAVAEFEAREPTEAVQALHRAIALAPNRADLWDLLAQTLVREGDPGAADAFRHLLALDPGAPNARFYLGRAKIEGGDVAGGLADWRALAAALPANDPRRQGLESAIQQVATTGKPPEPITPQAAVGAPQIQAMVDGLAARLQTDPDDPAGWVRLVRAYGVLGETDRRDQTLAAARRRYANRPDILTQLNAAQSASPVPPPAGSP
jgi:cytochrome c-type biogenesis protein CcmH